MKVKLSSVLTSYTGGQKKFNIEGKSVKEVIENMENKFPGIKFRFIDEQEQIRSHMHIFVNKDQIETLETEVSEEDEIFITQALSGGLKRY